MTVVYIQQAAIRELLARGHKAKAIARILSKRLGEPVSTRAVNRRIREMNQRKPLVCPTCRLPLDLGLPCPQGCQEKGVNDASV